MIIDYKLNIKYRLMFYFEFVIIDKENTTLSELSNRILTEHCEKV